MDTTVFKNTGSNPVHLFHLARSLAVVALLAALAFTFVRLKHEQFAIADEISATEKAIGEVRFENEVLQAKVASLTSRQALRRRVEEGFINVIPISGDRIARLIPPEPADGSGVLRTALNRSPQP
jgi:hypothetical protein